MRSSAAVIALAIVAALAAAGAGQADQAGASYTAPQAAQGAKQYAQHCASCHGAALQGINGPPLAGPSIHGTQQSVADIYAFLSTQMPLGAAGSLSPANYAAIMAFLLKKNGHRAGPAALTPAMAARADVTF